MPDYNLIYLKEPDYNLKDPQKLSIIFSIIETLDRNIEILDVGCGRGSYLSLLKSLGFNRILGIEISSVCAEKYLQEFPHIVSDFISFAKDTPDKKYDLLLCMDVLEHIEPSEVDIFIDHINRISKHSILGIANHSDVHQKVQLHLIEKPWHWWKEKLIKFNLIAQLHEGKFFMCENYG